MVTITEAANGRLYNEHDEPVQTVVAVQSDGSEISGGGASTYTEGDTDATMTVTAMGFEHDTGTSSIGPVNQTNPLPAQQAALAASVDQVSLGARASGGWTPHKAVSAASTNATSVKASAGQIGYIFCSNVNAEERYLKLYNKASAPTVGTDVPVHTLIIPGSTTGAGHAIPVPAGIEFTTGIAYALTTEATDAGSTGVAISEIVVNLGWK